MSLAEKQSSSNDLSDTIEASEFYFARGWTDGLPVIPPTKDSVQAMLDSVGREAGEEVAFIANRQTRITAEKVAVNAVMAGCKPSYMPVVVAALEAISDPLWGYHGPATSTGGSAVFMLVNGPIARMLDINSGDNLFGPGWRANATIGRAVRLVMRNVINTLPGKLDRSTLGHPGKFTYCIAENEAESPWPPVHVERGFSPEQNAVTVFAALAPHQIYNQLSNTAEDVLTTMADNMRISSSVTRQPQYVVLVAGEHMQIIAGDGWSKTDIKRFLFAHTESSVAHLKRTKRISGEILPQDEKTMRPLVQTPEDIIIVAAGGRAGAFSAFIPGWGSKVTSQSVTKEIRQP
ncbi:MAG: hypothetical protein V3T60_16410 [Candidatus Binatia bacterium]